MELIVSNIFSINISKQFTNWTRSLDNELVNKPSIRTHKMSIDSRSKLQMVSRQMYSSIRRLVKNERRISNSVILKIAINLAMFLAMFTVYAKIVYFFQV